MNARSASDIADALLVCKVLKLYDIMNSTNFRQEVPV